jgi:hypothetical protein
MDDHTAQVCPELSNHELFEKWRIVDTTKLEGERLTELERDLKESNRRYTQAYQVVLSHTSAIELHAFWKLFPTNDDGADAHMDLGFSERPSQQAKKASGTGSKKQVQSPAKFDMTNPMHMHMEGDEVVL